MNSVCVCVCMCVLILGVERHLSAMPWTMHDAVPRAQGKSGMVRDSQEW